MSNTGIKGGLKVSGTPLIPGTFNPPPQVSISFFYLAEALPNARTTEFIEKCCSNFLRSKDMVDSLE